jgi:UDP-N-acetylmuramyl tripeptide synthase
MKKLIKKILHYDKLYHNIKSSFLYHVWKKTNGQIANAMYGSPSKDFFVIGVTGTNGKTTTVNLIHKILNENVGKTMMVSTANIKI